MLSVAAGSHPGLKAENQDAWTICCTLTKATILVLADGVSACRYPRRASEQAVQLFTEILLSHFSVHALQTTIAQAVETVNEQLYLAEGDSRESNLLSTLTVLILLPEQKAVWVHVGDCRIYRYQSETLSQLTEDDQHHQGYYKGALSKALGAERQLHAAYREFYYHPQDVFALASDGFFSVLNPDELKCWLHEIQNAQDQISQIVERIMQSALAERGADNLTVLVACVGNAAINSSALVKQQRKIPGQLQSGQLLDVFHLEQQLHTSVRSTVYLATDTRNQQKVVIKIPSEYFEADAPSLSRFLKEEQIGLGLNHFSILQFYPKPQTSTFLYHVTEYVEGQTLREYMLQNPKLPLAMVLDWVAKIVVGLRVLHRKHLLHQDIKPENIMITATGQIKLLDLGSVGSFILYSEAVMPVGALEYVAPEYFEGKRIGIYSDLYSLAVIAYELLTSHLPFAEARKKRSIAHTPIKKYRPDLPDWLEGVFIRAFAWEPQARFQALSDFCYELDEQHHLHEIRNKPLLERNPLLFWKMIALISVVLNALLLVGAHLHV